MAQQWRYPATPAAIASGTAVTAAALTSGFGGLALPQLPPIDRSGGRLIVEVQCEMTSTSATPTVTFGIYVGSVGQAIGSKTLLAATNATALTATTTAWPVIIRYSCRFRTLNPSTGTIYGTGEQLFGTSLTAWTTTPFPITQALRTVSTLNTDQVNEIDFGITLSTTTGTPSITMADFAAEYSG